MREKERERVTARYSERGRVKEGEWEKKEMKRDAEREEKE